jgi:hypothetical protein
LYKKVEITFSHSQKAIIEPVNDMSGYVVLQFYLGENSSHYVYLKQSEWEYLKEEVDSVFKMKKELDYEQGRVDR